MQNTSDTLIPHNSSAGQPEPRGWDSSGPDRNDARERIRLDVIGAQKTRSAVLSEIEKDPAVSYTFRTLTEPLKEQFVEFCMGVRGLQVAYDRVFKHVFDPLLHPERLNDFLSVCIGQEVRILKVLPHESMRMTDEASQVIMDIVVQFTDGSLANVEIQKNGYKFPGARCACYSSDMTVRQYIQVKEECKKAGIPFSYQMLSKVYSIVLIQNSTYEFRHYPNTYIHHAKQRFDSGLELDLLQEYCLIPLDIFFASRQNKDRDTQPPGRLEAWLYFIGSDRPEDILDVIQAWPDFAELYRDVFRFRDHRKELISMYSEILSEYDRNTVFEMIEDYKTEIREAKAAIAERDSALAEKDSALAERDSTIAEKDSALAERDSTIAEKDSALAEKDARIRELEALLQASEKRSN